MAVCHSRISTRSSRRKNAGLCISPQAQKKPHWIGGIPEMLQKLQNDTKTIEKLQKTTKNIILRYKKHKRYQKA